jgi:hypothetical protein
MSNLPLVLRAAQEASVSYDPSRCEGPTDEDSLPAVLELTADGYVLTRGTRNTAVHQETTDDK